jgi:glycosyltransferase involved in cell wall biosynthesis
MRIGVYLGDFVPSIGGGFTFVSAVVDAFLEAAAASNHAYTVLARPAYWAQVAERAEVAGVAVHSMPAGILNKGGMMARHYVPALSAIAGGGPVERAARRRDLQFMWFVGGGAYEAVDVPYMATVWDVQHRTHPWFPEVVAGGIWDYREIGLARFLRRASRIITGTRVGVEQLGFYYQIPADRISILPHPTPRLPDANLAKAPPPRIERFASRKFLLYPAQFWPHKNHANLLAALRLVHEKLGSDVELVLTGVDKGNAGFVAGLARELGLSSAVHFLGFVSADELAYLYRRALALTYVSWSGPENLPPLEAFSLGCPVVNADYPGAREQLGDAVRYVDGSDPQSIAEGIVDVVAAAGVRERLVELGRKRAGTRTAAAYVAGVFQILDEFARIRSCWK